jgi:CRP/FNR family cyclic AMP-dependent transcriptional regulator
MDLLEQLQMTPEFAEFSADELNALSKAMVVKRYPHEHTFIREGEKGGSLYLLVEGTVLVTRYSHLHGTAEYVERLRSGALFGLISLIDHGYRAATCKAKGPVVVGSLPRAAFDLLCNANATLAQHFQFTISRQLAKDMRIYNQALSKLITSEDSTAFYGIIRAASFEYRGIERRREERRSSGERRKKDDFWSDYTEFDNQGS